MTSAAHHSGTYTGLPWACKRIQSHAVYACSCLAAVESAVAFVQKYIWLLQHNTVLRSAICTIWAGSFDAAAQACEDYERCLRVPLQF